MQTLRGQVKKALLVCVKTNRITSQTIMAREIRPNGKAYTHRFRYPSPNLNMKDKVQLAAILRGNTPWAKDKLKQARAHG